MYFGSSYFGPNYWGRFWHVHEGVLPTPAGRFWGARYFGAHYFGPSYFPGGQGVTPPPVTQPLIRRAVIAALLANPTVATLVGRKVRPGRIGEADVQPGITVKLISNRRDHNLSGPSGVSRAVLQIEGISPVATDTEAIAEAVRQLFDGYTGTLAGMVQVLETNLHDEDDQVEYADDGTGQSTYRTDSDVFFYYREPAPAR